MLKIRIGKVSPKNRTGKVQSQALESQALECMH